MQSMRGIIVLIRQNHPVRERRRKRRRADDRRDHQDRRHGKAQKTWSSSEHDEYPLDFAKREVFFSKGRSKVFDDFFKREFFLW